MCMSAEPQSVPPGSAQSYAVELLYEEPQQLDASALLAGIWERCPDIERPGQDQGPLRFFHAAHRVPVPGGGTLPVQTFISESSVFDPEALIPATKQTWKWRSAKQVVKRCVASIVVTDMLATNLDPRLRLGLFQRVLDGVLEVMPCTAIHWIPSQQMVDPATFREAMTRGEYSNPLHGAINVRLFQIAGYGPAPVPGGTGDSLMDTMGLSAFGLTDVQCHFRNLEHEEVARLLYGMAYQAFQNPDAPRDDEYAPGIGQNPLWKCSLERALQPPDRDVIDLDPGAPFSAGSRNG
jgi:hypothetical protein